MGNVVMDNNYQEYDSSIESLLPHCNKPFHFCSKDTHFLSTFKIIGLLRSCLVSLMSFVLTKWLT